MHFADTSTRFGREILFRRRVEGRIPLQFTGEMSRIVYLGNKSRLVKAKLGDLALADSHWNDIEASLLDALPPSNMDLDGFLGVRALQLKRLHLDFERNRVGWER